uniref:cilia- and flagella-associated protein 299 isoform X2 n=1 Tax=Scatophagus argus TaxID=75038 RepID=UPI001ED7FA9C|nr:cilia- and flagella-associated protein 299 isoform X2 [Scatophagus argus]
MCRQTCKSVAIAAFYNTDGEKMESSIASRFHECTTQFKVYEDYLDSKVTPMDIFYLKNREFARKLVEHGHKGTVLSREEFEEKKAAAQAAEAVKSNTFYNRTRPQTLASAGKELKDNFLKALAEREEANRSGKMTDSALSTVSDATCQADSSFSICGRPLSVAVVRTRKMSATCQSVIFIRDHNTLGQEVSGYIDYTHRLKTHDFEAYFSGKKRLMPGRSDLCLGLVRTPKGRSYSRTSTSMSSSTTTTSGQSKLQRLLPTRSYIWHILACHLGGGAAVKKWL